MVESETTLVITTRKLGTVREIVAYLEALESAHNHLYAFDILVERAQVIRAESEDSMYYKQRRPSFTALRPIRDVESQVLPGEALVLNAVDVKSPGFWEFLGSLNPLNTLREYLNDRHRRRQDREYRERQEHQRGDLEIEELKTKVVEGRIRLLRDAGVPEEQLRQILSVHVFEPLGRLDRFQDSELIGAASAARPDERHSDRLLPPAT
jgi:hypothetical protein